MSTAPKEWPWPRITSAVYYDDPARAIDWLCRAFGFAVRCKVEGEAGQIVHSELTYEDGLIMVGSSQRTPERRSPRALGGNTQSLTVYVSDVLAHCAQARAAGAKIIQEPTLHDYGEEYWADRSYEAEDLEGHRWWFAERLR